MDRFNPFSRRESHSSEAVTTYKVLTAVTWLLSVVTSVYYSVDNPHDLTIRRRIMDINYLYHSGFTLDATMVDIFWVFLLVSQIGYVSALFSSKSETVNAAASVGSHFIVNNLLHFVFVMLFVREHFIIAEIVLVANLFNLTALYFRHNTYPRFIHTPVASAPLAWTFVAVYWNGAIMVHHPHHLVARIFANVFVWAILVFGLFFIGTYKDYTMGFSLSYLAAALGVAQFLDKMVALQWIFAFIIMAVLFLLTLAVAVPAMQGREFRWRPEAPADTERAPLLAEN